MDAKIKYPRTFHLPWSLGATSDDKILSDVSHFAGKQVIVTEKMDGENRTLAQSYTHARSVDSNTHPSQHWVKGFHASISHNIPEGWRICGEDLFATHSIHYRGLPSYFLGFSIWDENNICLSYDEMMFYFELLNITPAPVLYKGTWDEKKISSLFTGESVFNSGFGEKLDNGISVGVQEGYVVRLADAFSYDDFGVSVAKFVRKDHVQTEEHWKNQVLIPNELAVTDGVLKSTDTSLISPPLIDFLRLQEHLMQIASAETSYEPSLWTKENPMIGHCGAVAYVVNQLYGGEIIKGKYLGETHYWNQLPDGRNIDLTLCQWDSSCGILHDLQGTKIPKRKTINPRFKKLYNLYLGCD